MDQLSATDKIKGETESLGIAASDQPIVPFPNEEYGAVVEQ